MAKKTVFESTNMASTIIGAERIMDVIATEDIENGTFGYIDELAEGETHVYNFHKGLKKGKTTVVADNPAWKPGEKDNLKQARDEYIIPEGTMFRARVVRLNDEFGVTLEGITTVSQQHITSAQPQKAYLTVDQSTGKLVASASSSPEADFEATYMRKRPLGNALVTTAHTYGKSAMLYEAKITKLA